MRTAVGCQEVELLQDQIFANGKGLIFAGVFWIYAHKHSFEGIAQICRRIFSDFMLCFCLLDDGCQSMEALSRVRALPFICRIGSEEDLL